MEEAGEEQPDNGASRSSGVQRSSDFVSRLASARVGRRATSSGVTYSFRVHVPSGDDEFRGGGTGSSLENSRSSVSVAGEQGDILGQREGENRAVDGENVSVLSRSQRIRRHIYRQSPRLRGLVGSVSVIRPSPVLRTITVSSGPLRQERMGNDLGIEAHGIRVYDSDGEVVEDDGQAAAVIRHWYRRQFRDDRVGRSARQVQERLPPENCDAVQESDIGKEVKKRSGQWLERCSPADMLRHRATAGHGHVRSMRAALGSKVLPNCGEILYQNASRFFIGRFSERGDKYVTCSQNGLITMFNVNGRVLTPYRRLEGINVGWSIIDLAFSPDEHFAVYSSWCDCLHMVNTVEGSEELHTPLNMEPDEDTHFCAFSLQFSKDNSQILAGCNHGLIYIYDRFRGERTLRFRGHLQDANGTCFGDDSSNILYTGSDDCLVKAWDRRTLSEQYPHPVAEFAGHLEGLTCVAPRGDGRYIISNGKDHVIKLWDIRRPATRATIDAAARNMRESHYRGGEPTRKIGGDPSVMSYYGHTTRHTLVQCRFSPLHTTGQRYIYTGSGYGSVVIYDLLTGKVETELLGHNNVVRDVSWHPYHDGLLTSASWDGKICLWQCRGDGPQAGRRKEGKSEADSDLEDDRHGQRQVVLGEASHPRYPYDPTSGCF